MNDPSANNIFLVFPSCFIGLEYNYYEQLLL
jgi:hypothetical protein